MSENCCFIKSDQGKLALIISIGLIIASTVFGVFYYNTNYARQTVSVVGIASTESVSDTGKLSVTVNIRSELDGEKEAMTEVQKSADNLIKILQQKGLDINSMTRTSLSSYPRYENSRVIGYEASQTVNIVSEKLDTLESLFFKLPLDGVGSSRASVTTNMEYYIKDSNLTPIKHKLIELATADAIKRSEIMVRKTKQKVDKLVSAKCGVFQITVPQSTEVSDYGFYDTTSKKKQITVTVNTVFSLK